jgi:hypothetical protein
MDFVAKLRVRIIKRIDCLLVHAIAVLSRWRESSKYGAIGQHCHDSSRPTCHTVRRSRHQLPGALSFTRACRVVERRCFLLLLCTRSIYTREYAVVYIRRMSIASNR